MFVAHYIHGQDLKPVNKKGIAMKKLIESGIANLVKALSCALGVVGVAYLLALRLFAEHLVQSDNAARR